MKKNKGAAIVAAPLQITRLPDDRRPA